MRHVIVGLGAVGGLMATLLAKSGQDVIGIVRRDALAGTPREFELTKFDGAVLRATFPVTATLSECDGIDVLWIATKAVHLDRAVQPLRNGGPSCVIPLLNGLEHVPKLARMYGDAIVAPASIAVEADRISPGKINQLSSFVRLVVSARAQPYVEAIVEPLQALGATLLFASDESSILWNKLVFLAPFALVNAATGLGPGAIRSDPDLQAVYRQLVMEVAAVGRAEGAEVDADWPIAILEAAPDGMTSSLLKDIRAGRPHELDAIAGAVIRAGEKHGFAVPTVRRFCEQVRALDLGVDSKV